MTQDFGHEHFIEQCECCSKVAKQCRCFGQAKAVRIVTCQSCQAIIDSYPEPHMRRFVEGMFKAHQAMTQAGMTHTQRINRIQDMLKKIDGDDDGKV
jgi:hypothetical protein